MKKKIVIIRPQFQQKEVHFLLLLCLVKYVICLQFMKYLHSFFSKVISAPREKRL